MPNTITTPIIGRLRLLGSGLFTSVFGRPVAGSLGSLSATMVPHSSVPQLAMRTVALPPSVDQVPVGSAANVADGKAPSMTAAINALHLDHMSLFLVACCQCPGA